MTTIENQVLNLDDAKEVPWRPGYQNFPIAGKAQGVSVSATLSVLQPGAGAPLHFHENCDEILVVLEGGLNLQIGDEHMVVSANSCIAIPAKTPHAFFGAGPGETKFLAYLPQQGAYLAAVYLDGAPPVSGDLK